MVANDTRSWLHLPQQLPAFRPSYYLLIFFSLREEHDNNVKDNVSLLARRQAFVISTLILLVRSGQVQVRLLTRLHIIVDVVVIGRYVHPEF